MKYSDDITLLKGVGQKKAELLGKMNITKIGDLINLYPRTYQDRRTVTPVSDSVSKDNVLIKAQVVQIVKSGYRPGGKRPLNVLVDDGTARMEIVFFNAKFMQNAFKEGEEYYFYGRATKDYGKIKMVHPEFTSVDKGMFQGIIPVYPLTAGLTQNDIRKWQKEAFSCMECAEEFLPEEIIKKNNLCSYSYALKNIHFPDDVTKLKEARYRLVFDEMLLLQTGLFALKETKSGKGRGIYFDRDVDPQKFINSLPYELTNAQKRVVKEIMDDMESPDVMTRLVQGDVGSGKTAIAEIAMYKASECGYQAVLMAPTEILAKQHFEGVKRDFEPFGISVGFLSSSVKTQERRELLAKLESGEINVLIGTHAVIQPDVVFNNLGLVITDEQHRFGVNQRNLLGSKGKNPDTLVMTATPIPRTLAVILYGDLDISIIDELPPGRQKIITKVADSKKRPLVYDFLMKEIEKGRQAYIVAPLIEDSEAASDLRSAESLYEELSKKFKEFSVALLHGEMKQAEKDEIMDEYAKGNINILVSTVVIEVGINVPNATVMILENAERFGLAQMHQLRGRVGRGEHKSYCILITDAKSEVSKERAEIMVSTDSGFVIAEKDLELRGPGEFFGTRQHGLPDMKLANLVKHIDMLELVKEEAKRILEEDPSLTHPKYSKFRERMNDMFGGELALKM
ncbi:MAG: ATP-dependent DNA helicase RecG [Firmicutes bacterium]|nr:ATP-dependent DNA helicase RecG [Bacillota bacterium]